MGTESQRSHFAGGKPERTFLYWGMALVGLNIAAIFMLALRAESPSFIRNVLDLLLQICLGGTIAGLAFRALFLFPFRILELISIVITHSLAMMATLRGVDHMIKAGVLYQFVPFEKRDTHYDDPTGTHAKLQACLLVTSVLIGGAALGLRNCAKLKLDHARERVVVVVCNMLGLPAAAGLPTFFVMMIHGAMGRPEHRENGALYMLFWIACALVCAINAKYFFTSLALRATIDAKETKWKT